MVHVNQIDQKINSLENRIKDIEHSRSVDTEMTSELKRKQNEIEALMSKINKFERDQ